MLLIGLKKYTVYTVWVQGSIAHRKHYWLPYSIFKPLCISCISHVERVSPWRLWFLYAAYVLGISQINSWQFWSHL